MIQLQAGEAYLIYGKAQAGKTTLAYQLAKQPAVYIPTETYKGTLSRWQSVFQYDLHVEQVAGWSPEEVLVNLFKLFGDDIRLGLIAAKNKASETIHMRSFNVEAWGKESRIKQLFDGGERIFIIDSIAGAVKPVFEFAGDLRGNLAPRDSCMSRLLYYVTRLCQFGATCLLIDHESKDPTNVYDKPHPYGPASLRYTCKYWLLLNQSQAKDHTDVHELILTRNIGDREYAETHWMRLTDTGFVDMAAEEVQTIMAKRK